MFFLVEFCFHFFNIEWLGGGGNTTDMKDYVRKLNLCWKYQFSKKCKILSGRWKKTTTKKDQLFLINLTQANKSTKGKLFWKTESMTEFLEVSICNMYHWQNSKSILCQRYSSHIYMSIYSINFLSVSLSVRLQKAEMYKYRNFYTYWCCHPFLTYIISLTKRNVYSF